MWSQDNCDNFLIALQMELMLEQMKEKCVHGVTMTCVRLEQMRDPNIRSANKVKGRAMDNVRSFLRRLLRVSVDRCGLGVG